MEVKTQQRAQVCERVITRESDFLYSASGSVTNAKRRSASGFHWIQEAWVGGDCRAELPETDRVCLEKAELLECWGFTNLH